MKTTSQFNPARELSIIFVNWNSFNYLYESISSIYRSSEGIDLEIIVVDNASSSDDAAQLSATFPNISVIRSTTNLGFAGANNLGFQHSSGKCLLFLNPDTEVVGSAIETMLELWKELPDVGILGCKLLNTNGSIQTSCIQRYPTILNQILDAELLRRRWPHWKIWGIGSLVSGTNSTTEVEVVSGACLMVDRETFQRVGMFDQSYFMYAEDVDLCYQVRRLGRKVYSTNQANVIHHGGGTSKARKGGEWVAIMQREAILRFCRNTRGHFYAQLFRLAMGVSAVGRLVLLIVVSPFMPQVERRELVHFTSTKWLHILKWSLGFEQSVSSINKGI